MCQSSEKTKELLVKVKAIWAKLQECSKGLYVSEYKVLPPSQYTYWNYLIELEKCLIALNGKIPEVNIHEICNFRHTMYNKEGQNVKEFGYSKRISDVKNNNRLSELMVKANKQIHLDLFSLLTLIEKEYNDINNPIKSIVK